MTWNQHLVRLVTLLLVMGTATRASAQSVVGLCIDQSRDLMMLVRSDHFMFAPGSDVQGFMIPETSGQMFLQMPAVKPWKEAVFVGWGGELVQMTPSGAQQIGGCQLIPGIVPPLPEAVWREPAVSTTMGVYVDERFVPLPAALAAEIQDAPFAAPLTTSEAQALSCWSDARGDRNAFGRCMVRAMLGDRERAAYDCVASGGQDRGTAATCLVGALGGAREREVSDTLNQCQQHFGSDYRRYPLCLASQTIVAKEEVNRLLGCIQQQGLRSTVDVLGTAVCYGSQPLRLNAEAQLTVQCAVATGAQPYAFAACVGGQVTANELDKCLSDGIGGPGGCFGPRNTVMQGLGAAGSALAQHFGPHHELVKRWSAAYRDAAQRPASSPEPLRTFRNVAVEVGRQLGARHDVLKAVERVVPHIRRKR